MTNFIKFYKGINIVPEDEWTYFFESLFTGLPYSFRISENHRKCNNVYEGKPGTLSQAELLREYMKNTVFPKLADVSIDEKTLQIEPIPWYPKELAWKLNVDAKAVTINPELRPLFDFIYQEEKAQFIFKQEIVSMISPMLVDIGPSDKVLEMCCAPGYQTAQIAELFHSNGKKMPDGFIVSNDTETNRINYRWAQGPNTFFCHEDAKSFPDLYLTEEHGPDSKVLYDKIFIDAPSSMDGSFRKNIEARAEWNVTKAQKLHKSLKSMLRRGLELLEVNGQLVYSTTSLNPIENEAVVAALLKEAPETLELVDVESRLPGFHTRPGMSKWKVMSQGLVFYETFEACPAWFKKENEETMFPPSEEDQAVFNLEKCMRIMPHDNDTGAFFCAVFTKLGTLPWQKEEEETMETEVKEEKEEGDAATGETDEAGDAKKDAKSKAPPYNKPLRCDINVCVTEIQWTTECTDDNMDTITDSEVSTFEKAPMRISKTSIPSWYLKKMEEVSAHFEDVESDNSDWQTVKKLFDIKRFDPVPNMLKHVQDNRATMYFYFSPMVKTLIKCNPDVVKKSKFHAGGLMIMKTQDFGSKVEVGLFGHLILMPHFGKRLIQVSKDEMIALLRERGVMITKFSPKVQKELEALDEGPAYFIYEPKGKNADPKCTIIQRREKFKKYVKEHVFIKGDNYHQLRMCGVDPTPLAADDKDEEEMEAE